MKSTYIIILILFISISQIFSQALHLVTYFDNDYSWLTFEEDDTSNIWVVGEPNKVFFNSAYGSFTNALVTNLEDPYPSNNSSSFTIKLDVSDYDDVCWYILRITIEHKYDTDSLMDGGYMEISYDDGENWMNIINDTIIESGMIYGYGPNDTIKEGIPAFSGNSEGWSQISIVWLNENEELMRQIQSAIIRFTFISDSIDNNKEGWMIGFIEIILHDYCRALSINNRYFKQNKISILPNPIVNKSILRLDNNNYEQIIIYNIYGQVIKTINIEGNKEIELDSRQYKNGLYYYKATNKNSNTIIDKFLITK